MNPQEDIGLVAITETLCAWDITEDEIVYELVRFLDEKASLWPEYTYGCLSSLARMSRCPMVTDDIVHPGALRYYEEKGIKVGGKIELHRLN
jgi:TRAP-type uncharacterized transport system substrate-binding protein